MGNYRFIFYSVLSLALLWGGHLSRTQQSNEFLLSFQLWQEPILAGVICGLGSALMGVYILLNRTVFLSLALAQGAGLGIFLTFWICSMLGYHLGHSTLPLITGLSLASLTALTFVLLRKKTSLSEESLIGIIYLVCSGLILIVGDRITQGLHDKDNLLFGNAVAVTRGDLIQVGVVMALIFLVHGAFRRAFIYASADPTFMKTRGMRTSFWLGLLYLLLTLGITVSLKTLGALPIFALMVLPPFLALKSARSLGEAFAIALLIGGVLPALGYYYSYLFDFPTGASLVFVSLFYLGAGWFESRALKLNRSMG